jgi:hypothetical protein
LLSGFITIVGGVHITVESPQFDIFAESNGQSTETCVESEFESKPKVSPITEIPILSSL